MVRYNLFVAVLSITFLVFAGSVHAADIVYDISSTGHTFDGFGAQTWDSTADNNRVLTELNIKYVRTSSTSSGINAQGYGAEVVYLIWSAPSQWLDGSKELLTQYVDDYAIYWGDRVSSIVGSGLRPEYIELSNEPDGHWNTYISPANYNALVKLVRSELDSRGFTDVGIVGPGLAHFDWDNHSSQWIGAMDPCAVDSLSAWSSHTWDDGDTCRSDGYSTDYSGGAACIEAHWPEFGDSADAKDPTLPKFITEYATKENNFHGFEYRHPDQYKENSAANFMPYAARVYENTLALLNSGANAPFIWQAKDMSWETKGWGLIGLSSTPKPVFYTLKTLYPKIPVGAKVLDSPNHSSGYIYSGAFIKDDRLVIGLVNDDDTEHSTTVRIQGVVGLSIQEAEACVIDHLGDPCAVPPYDYDTAQIVPQSLSINPDNSIDVTLPGDSTLTIVCDVAMTGDANYDRKVNLGDFALVAKRWLDIGCGDCEGADLSDDGDVDMDDAIVLAQNWLTDYALMGYWPLDGDASDSSSYNHFSTIYGSPIWDPNGITGQALVCDGGDDYIKIDNFMGIPGGQSRTVSAWIKTSQDDGEILTYGEGTATGGRWVFRVKPGGYLNVQVGGGTISGTTVITDWLWHHVAAVLENDGSPNLDEVKLYVDGTEEAVPGTSVAINTILDNEVKIGVFSDTAKYFEGLIDEVRIYNRALTEAGIQALAEMGD